MLKLILFVLPLGLDTFAVSAALGMRGLPKRQRLRVSMVMSGFEMAMPLVGLFLGNASGHLIGGRADYLAAAALVALGGWMLVHDEDERAKVSKLGSGHGLALVALGLSVSLDELAIGFTIGLLRLSLWIAVLLVGLQAFLFAQLGLRLGARLNATFRERAEQLAALALLGLAVLLVAEKLA